MSNEEDGEALLPPGQFASAGAILVVLVLVALITFPQTGEWLELGQTFDRESRRDQAGKKAAF